MLRSQLARVLPFPGNSRKLCPCQPRTRAGDETHPTVRFQPYVVLKSRLTYLKNLVRLGCLTTLLGIPRHIPSLYMHLHKNTVRSEVPPDTSWGDAGPQENTAPLENMPLEKGIGASTSSTMRVFHPFELQVMQLSCTDLSQEMFKH